MRLLLFDPYFSGHHVEYVTHLMRGWRYRAIPGWLGAAVPDSLISRHPELPNLCFDDGTSGVNLIPLGQAGDEVVGAQSLWAIGLWQRRLLKALVKDHRPEHLLCLYFDHAQLAFALGTRFSADTQFSGILLRPTLTEGYPASNPREKMAQMRKAVLLRRALGHRNLNTVYTLDPFAVEPMTAMSRNVDVQPLADPLSQVPEVQNSSEVRKQFGIEDGRRIGLIFGSLTRRKGILEVLRSLKFIGDEAARRCALLVAGQVDYEIRVLVNQEIDKARGSAVQIVVHDGYIPEQEASDLIHSSDFLLLPYQRHVGSSGVLIRAAAAGKPVITQDYGLVGQLAREHRLGMTLDTTDPEAIAIAIEAAVNDNLSFDLESAACFADANSIDAFVATLLKPFEGNEATTDS